MEVYKLTPVLDDPRYDEFDFEELPSLLDKEWLYQDFDGKDRAKLSWEPVRLANVWTPQFAKGAVRPFVDYTRVSHIPVFGQRAVTVLREFLDPNGELLPLVTKKGTYLVYNILTKSTSLDVARSKLKFVSGKETAFAVEYFWFDENKLRNHSIFRIREYPAIVLVTDAFKDRVEQAGLNGFYFIKVWPFAEGESWEALETKRSRELRKQTESLRGQCLTIRLSIGGWRPRESDREAVLRIAHQLDEFLSEGRDSADAEFIGAIDAVEPGWRHVQIILACPNVDRLVDCIRPWLSSIDWPRAVKIDRKYGNRFDIQANKVREKIK